MSDGVNIDTLLRSLDDGPQWPCKQAAFTLRGCLDDAELGYACRELGIETVEQLRELVGIACDACDERTVRATNRAENLVPLLRRRAGER